MGRTSAARSITINRPVASTLVLGPDPFRIALHFGFTGLPDITNATPELLMSNSPIAFPGDGVFALPVFFGSHSLLIEQWGNLITGPIHLLAESTAFARLTVTEVTLAVTRADQLRDL